MEDKKLQEEAAINLTMPVSPTARMLNMKLAPTQSIEVCAINWQLNFLTLDRNRGKSTSKK